VSTMKKSTLDHGNHSIQYVGDVKSNIKTADVIEGKSMEVNMGRLETGKRGNGQCCSECK